MKPVIKYTNEQGVSLAYQVVGSGPIDIVFMPGWVSNIDLMWNQPEFNKFMSELSRLGRVIIFDERGTGLSDRADRLISIEERVMDIQTIMNATQSKKAVLMGQWAAASAAALFANQFPERVEALILISPHAKGQKTPEYPWALSRGRYNDYLRMLKLSWGSPSTFASFIPPKEKSGKLLEWVTHYYRCSGTPKDAILTLQAHKELDITQCLDHITPPTLIMAMSKDIHLNYEEVAFFSKKIHHSFFVTLSESYPLFWAVNTTEILSYIKPFLKSNFTEVPYSKVSYHFPSIDDPSNFKKYVTKVVEKNLSDQNFKVADLAKELSMGQRQLQRNFKKFIRQSPSQFITHRRLCYAKKLLDHTGTNFYLSEIAFQSGFTDPSYFSKCFKRVIGVTPSDYVMTTRNYPHTEYLNAS